MASGAIVVSGVIPPFPYTVLPPTVEKIDSVRVITNQSSGKTGTSLAAELVSAGAKVTLVYGPGTSEPPKGAKIIRVNSIDEMNKAVKECLKKKFDIAIMSAAASDYVVKNTKKLGIKVESGIFGADMRIMLVNEGPITFLLECS